MRACRVGFSHTRMSSGKKTAKQITRERAQRQEEEAKMLGGVLSKKRKKETRRSAVSDAVGAEDNDDAETGDHLSTSCFNAS
jgi:hypothetical protein